MSLERLVGLAIDQTQYVIGPGQTFLNGDLGLVFLRGNWRLRDNLFSHWSGDWHLRGNFFGYWRGDWRRYRRVAQQRAPCPLHQRRQFAARHGVIREICAEQRHRQRSEEHTSELQSLMRN